MNKVFMSFVFTFALITGGHALGTVKQGENPHVRIGKIRYDYKLVDYRLFLNGERVFVGQVFTNLGPGQEYEFRVIDEDKREVFSQKAKIIDKKRQTLVASEAWSRFWYPRISIMGGNWVSGGVDYFVTRYTWLGAGMGVSYWYRSDVDDSFFLLNPYIEYGTYYIGGRTDKWRVGLGGRLNFHLGFPYSAWESHSMNQDADGEIHEPSSLSAELYSTTEWGIWTLGFALRLDLQYPRFQFIPSLGVKF